MMERALNHLRSKLPYGDCRNGNQVGTWKAISDHRFHKVGGTRMRGLK